MGEFAALFAEGGSSYEWFDENGNLIPCTGDCEQVFVTPSVTTTYTVNIHYGYSDGCLTTVTEEIEVVVDCNLPCEANPSFGFELEVCEVYLYAENDGDEGIFIWDFGDGFTAIGEDVTHAYLYDGTFNVCLMVDCGDNFPIRFA